MLLPRPRAEGNPSNAYKQGMVVCYVDPSRTRVWKSSLVFNDLTCYSEIGNRLAESTRVSNPQVTPDGNGSNLPLPPLIVGQPSASSRFGYHGLVTDKQWIEFLKESIASHDRQIGEVTERIAAQAVNIDKLVVMSNRDAVDIASLARIAESHDKRLDRLEGGRA